MCDSCAYSSLQGHDTLVMQYISTHKEYKLKEMWWIPNSNPQISNHSHSLVQHLRATWKSHFLLIVMSFMDHNINPIIIALMLHQWMSKISQILELIDQTRYLIEIYTCFHLLFTLYRAIPIIASSWTTQSWSLNQDFLFVMVEHAYFSFPWGFFDCCLPFLFHEAH